MDISRIDRRESKSSDNFNSRLVEVIDDARVETLTFVTVITTAFFDVAAGRQPRQRLDDPLDASGNCR